jgi:hypothetical protein
VSVLIILICLIAVWLGVYLDYQKWNCWDDLYVKGASLMTLIALARLI